jgi:hypothetical protein
MPTKKLAVVTINLTEDCKCFTHYLQERIETIYQYANDNYTSKDELVDWIVELIQSASYNKDAKPRFINDIRYKCQTRKAVLERCLKAISNAVEYRVA